MHTNTTTPPHPATRIASSQPPLRDTLYHPVGLRSAGCQPADATQSRPLEFGISGFGIFLGFGILGFGISPLAPASAPTYTTSAHPATPNIILINCDDLGFGDTGAYGATAIKTPNVDRLARSGVRFTNAYATSATCTPSRFSMLTGEYAWRRDAAILPGDAPLIIEPGRQTLPALLREAGYTTGIVGKWHLGLGTGNIDWNGDIKPGPLEVGFDESFIMAATCDRVPCVYIENHRIYNLDPADPIRVSYKENFPGQPTGLSNPELVRVKPAENVHAGTIVNGIGRIGFSKGGKAALWKDEDMADVFIKRAVDFIDRHADASANGAPFFLYYAAHEPHVPRVPNPRFVGLTGLGPRGDSIAEMDWCVGQLLAALERHNLLHNTLIIFTSDNGPILGDGYMDGAIDLNGAHRPAGNLRGNKYSMFEGGTHIPLIVSWPGRVRPGVSDALISQLDFPASLAALVGGRLDPAASPDSQNMLAALLGDSLQGRADFVEEGEGSHALTLRQGPWKYIPPHKGPHYTFYEHVETGNDPKPQLYNYDDDPGESLNLAEKYPERVRDMAARLDEIIGASATPAAK